MWEQGEVKGAGGVGGSWKVAEHVEAVTFALEEILTSHGGGLGEVSVCSVFRRVCGDDVGRVVVEVEIEK